MAGFLNFLNLLSYKFVNFVNFEQELERQGFFSHCTDVIVISWHVAQTETGVKRLKLSENKKLLGVLDGR